MKMTFDYCPSCGGSLDTGWECNRCGRDWLPWAYPRWSRALDRLRRWIVAPKKSLDSQR